jgi:hypothetical protein
VHGAVGWHWAIFLSQKNPAAGKESGAEHFLPITTSAHQHQHNAQGKTLCVAEGQISIKCAQSLREQCNINKPTAAAARMHTHGVCQRVKCQVLPNQHNN